MGTRSRVLEHHRLRRRNQYAYIPVGGRPPAPTEIPVCWLTQPLTLRLQRPFTHAEVTTTSGGSARADATTVATYKVFPFEATLDTDCDADPSNLAHWAVTYNATPRMTSPLLRMDLLYRTDAERLLVLGVARNKRIKLTGLPTEWPTGADTLIVRGISHTIALDRRVVEWVTSPVVGAAAGIPGPWFRWGSSSWSGSDIRPF